MKNDHVQLKEKVEKYASDVNATFVSLPKMTITSEKSRKQKEAKHKNEQRKKERNTNAVTNFVQIATKENVKTAYFDSLLVDTCHLEELPQPRTTLDMNMKTFLALSKTHRRMILSMAEGKDWFAMDVLA